MIKKLILIALVALIAIMLTSCGGSESDSPDTPETVSDAPVKVDLTTPEAALATYYSAFQKEDWKSVCAAQTSEGKKRAVKQFNEFINKIEKMKKSAVIKFPDPPKSITCESILDWNNSVSGDNSTKAFEGIEVGESQISGKTAVVTITVPADNAANFEGGEQQVNMVLDGEEWKVKT
mgnify:CR=1 FL=1